MRRRGAHIASWSDIYYIPNRMFKDFALLAKSYGSFPIFHEIAVPTMFRILDRTYSPHRSRSMSVVQYVGDCWGGCCNNGATKQDVLDNRCGHRFDLTNWDIANVHFERLRENAKMLGKPKPWRAAAGRVPKSSSKESRKRSVGDVLVSEVGMRDSV
jgi:hypothetical protein